MRPTDWYRSFLNTRGLTSPDKRPLYQYRMSDAEYNDLRSALRSHRVNLNSYQHWDVCFVLFSSAWWFRYYSGGPWKWEPIENEINSNHLANSQRAQLVASGLRQLGRRIYHDSSGYDYLGTVVQEAGIPLETLDNQGWLRRFLTTIYRDFVVQETTYLSLLDSIKDQGLRMSIPATFQSPSFYELIKDLVEEIFRLRKQHQLGSRANAVAHLDTYAPQWSDHLPIPIESPKGRAFLNDLFSDLAKIREPEPYPIEVDRILTQSNQGKWTINLSPTLPKQPVDFDDLRLSASTQEVLKKEGKLAVFLQAGSSYELPLGTAYHTRIGDRDLIQLPQVTKLSIPSQYTFENFRLSLMHTGEVLQTLIAADEIDETLPLVFVEKSDQLLFVNQGSWRTSAKCAYVIAGSAFQAVEGQPQHMGIYSESKNVFKILEVTEFANQDGDRLRISVNTPDSNDWRFELIGTQLPSYIRANHSSVYIGNPRVYQTNRKTGQRMFVSGSTEFRRVGTGHSWHALSNSTVGEGRLRLLDSSGTVIYTRKVFLLPPGFEIQSNNNNQIDKGSLDIRQSLNLDISVISENVRATISTNALGKQLQVESTTSSPPEFIQLKIKAQPLDNLILDVPFPSFGAQVFRMGTLLRRADKIYSSALMGLRIRLHNTNRNEIFQIELKALGEDATDLYYQEEKEVVNNLTEIALVGLKEEIEKLMAAQHALDKTLAMLIKDSMGRTLSINHILQYELSFQIKGVNDSKAIISSHEPIPNGLKFLTFRFDIYNYTSTPINLIATEIPDERELVLEGFPAVEGPATFFVFPAPESSAMFRPFTILLGELPGKIEDNMAVTSIKDVANIRDYIQRNQVLDRHLEALAAELSHEDWKEILWQKNQTAHLPLAALDIWSSFSRKPDALIALFCKQDASIIESLTSQFPILLEAIPIESWLRGLSNFKTYCLANYDETTTSILLNAKLSKLKTAFGLDGLVEILEKEVLMHSKQPSLPISVLANIIDDCYNKLIRSGINPESLPYFLSSEFSEAIRELPANLQQLIPAVQAPRFKSLVYLPFLLAYKSIQPNAYPLTLSPAQVYKMRRIKRFKEDWFNFIYDIVQGYCWQNRN